MTKITLLNRWAIAILGLAMVGFAIAVPPTKYGQLLLGTASKDLSWGPLLFCCLLGFHGLALILVGLKWNVLSSRNNNVAAPSEKVSRISLSEWVLLLLLTAIVIVLRVWNLNSDLWVDEVFTLLDLVRLPFGEILTSFSSQNQHMLYSVLAHASTSLFGESPASIRLPSVLFGIGSIWALFFLSRRLFNTKEALLVSALMTVSYHHIWFSQNARGYMGLLFFTLTATWFWSEALETNRWRWWIGYVAAVVLGMWVHMTMAFVVAAHGLIYLVFLVVPEVGKDNNIGLSLERSAGRRPIISWLFCLTVTLQLYALSLPEFLRVGLHEESKNSEWTNPLWVITESIRSLSIGFSSSAVVIFGGVFLAFGWLTMLKKNKRLAILAVLPAFLAGTTMLLLGHNIWPRFFFFSMGFGLLIVVAGAKELGIAINKKVQSLTSFRSVGTSVYAGILFVLFAASLMTLPRNYKLPKQDFTGARDFVEAHRSQNDKIVAVGIADVMYPKYFAPNWSSAKTGEELRMIDQENRKVWLVYTLPIEISAFRPDIWEVIKTEYEVVRVFPGTLNGGEIFVCQKSDLNSKVLIGK